MICRHLKREKELEKEAAKPAPQVDYSLKQGQKISLNIGKLKLHGDDDDDSKPGHVAAKPSPIGERDYLYFPPTSVFCSLSVLLGFGFTNSPQHTGLSSTGGLLPPPPSSGRPVGASSSAPSSSSKPAETAAAADQWSDFFSARCNSNELNSYSLIHCQYSSLHVQIVN